MIWDIIVQLFVYALICFFVALSWGAGKHYRHKYLIEKIIFLIIFIALCLFIGNGNYDHQVSAMGGKYHGELYGNQYEDFVRYATTLLTMFIAAIIGTFGGLEDK